MDDIVVIALFRHGMTEDNRKKAYSGWKDTPLCEHAIKEIQPMKNQYAQYFSSDLSRCLDTCKLLFPRVTPSMLKELREIHFGDWEGCTYEELKGNGIYQSWLTDPHSVSPPKGEHLSQFKSRINKGWLEVLRRRDTDRLAIVTHSGVIREWLVQFAPEQRDFWDWTVPYAGGYELIFHKDRLRRGERCTLLQEVPSTVNDHGFMKPIT